MQELAQATFTYEQFPEVMSMLWKRMLQENKRNWRRTYKVCNCFPNNYCITFKKKKKTVNFVTWKISKMRSLTYKAVYKMPIDINAFYSLLAHFINLYFSP